MKTMNLKVQRGFSLITAIFLLVVVASLGALMMTFYTAQQQSSAIDALGARAYQTARAGIEWGAFQITQSGIVSPPYVFAAACQSPAVTSSVPVTQPVTLAAPSLSPYNLMVSCYATSNVEGSPWVYSITATASGVGGATPGGTDHVERVIQATIDANSGIIYQRESY